MSSILLEAATDGDAELLRLALSKEHSAEVTPEDINQALLRAAINGHNDCVIILLDAKAFPDTVTDKGNTPLLLAVKYYHVDVVQQLIAAGASVDMINKKGQTALYCAAWANHTDLVRLLLDANSQPNITHGDGFTPLMFANINANYEMTELLLQHGADVKRRTNEGDNALHFCSENGGTVELAKLLLKYGSRVDVRNCRVSSPLELACEQNNLPLVKFLREHSDNSRLSWNAMNCGLVPTVMCGRTDLLKFLLEAGIDPNNYAMFYSPVMRAAAKGYYDTLRLFIRYGGKTDDISPVYSNVTTSEKPPIYNAVWKDQVKVADLLYNSSVLSQREIKQFLTCDKLEERIRNRENINTWMKDTFSNAPSLFHISRQNIRAILLSQLTQGGASQVSHNTANVNKYHTLVSELPIPEILKMLLAMPDL